VGECSKRSDRMLWFGARILSALKKCLVGNEKERRDESRREGGEEEMRRERMMRETREERREDER